MRRVVITFLIIMLFCVSLLPVGFAEKNTVFETDRYTITLPGEWNRKDASTGTQFYKGSRFGGDYIDIREMDMPYYGPLDDFWEGYVEGVQLTAIDEEVNSSYIEKFDTKCLLYNYRLIILGYKSYSFAVLKDGNLCVVSYIYTSDSLFEKEESDELNAILENMVEKGK